MRVMPVDSSYLNQQHSRMRGALVVMGLALLPGLYYLFGPKGERVEVARKTWSRDIEIEERIWEVSSDWCDAMPVDAQELNRRLMTDPSGARSDATEHCRFKHATWRAQRSAHSEGEAGSHPAWAAATLSALSADQIGAERWGKRHERYELHLRSRSDGKVWTCKLTQAAWEAIPLGLKFRLQVDRFGVANCTSLPRGD